MKVRLVSQQAAAVAGAFIVPSALGPFLTLSNWTTLLPIIAGVMAVAAAGAYIATRIAATRLAIQEAPPHKYIAADCMAAIQKAANELARNKADPKLLQQAEAASGGQEGRTVAEYIGLSMAAFHAKQPVVLAEEENAVDAPVRAAWAIAVASINTAFFATVNHVWDLSLTRSIWIFSVLVLTPLMVTAARVIFLDEPAAYQHPLLQRVRRARPTRHARGRWHKRTRGRELPVFRGILVLCLGGAVALYVLREVVLPTRQFQVDAPAMEPRAEADLPEPTPTPTLAPPPRLPRITPPPRHAEPTPPPVTSSWRALGNRMSRVAVDSTVLRTANIDLPTIEAAIAEQEPRIRSAYLARHHEIPTLRGRVHVEFQINTSGWVAQSRIVATELNDAETERSLRDYLDALQFGVAPNRPVTVNYYINFQP